MKKLKLFSLCYFIYASFIGMALTINAQADYDAVPEEDEVTAAEVQEAQSECEAPEAPEAEEAK